jgi:hypothetical protein
MIKNTILSTLFSLILIQSHGALAHEGGHAPIDEQQAMMVATKVVDHIVSTNPDLGFGKLPASWQGLPEEAKLIHEKNTAYYIVAVTNKKEGKTLYVLMSSAGEVYDANLSGVFEGLK